MLIDSHQHVFWHDRDDAGLVADLNEHHVDQAWLLSWPIPPEEDNPQQGYHRVLNPEHVWADGTHAGMPLSDVIRTHHRYPERFVPGYCPDPLRGNAPQFFEAAYRMHGVRVCGEWKFRVLFDDPRCLELYRKAGELGCPVVLHLDVPYLPDRHTGHPVYRPLWHGGTVENLERAMQACPGTNFVGHAPGFWREISGDAATDSEVYPFGPVTDGGRLYDLFDRYPNLYADLSAGSGLKALSRDPEHARKFIERYQDRLLFGRDCYGGELFAFLSSLNLPEPTREKLFFRNAQGLLDKSRPEAKPKAVVNCQAIRARRQASHGLLECLGGNPPYQPGKPIAVEIVGEVKTPTHQRLHLRFGPADADWRGAAYLLTPQGRPCHGRAMLCLHQTVEYGKDEPAGVQGDPELAYARELVERGFVCFVPDYPSFGEFHPDLSEICGVRWAIAVNRMAMDLLEARPEIEPGGIGVIGHSLGGHTAIFTAVLEPRLQAVVTCCGFTRFERYGRSERLKPWAQPRYMPRVWSAYDADPARMPFDFPDLIAALAPRAFLAVAPQQDDNFAVAGVRETMALVEPIYRRAGAAERLAARYPLATHRFPRADREAAYDFLARMV